MFVSRLSLTDFRNYETVEVALRRGANLFVGSNGQGKTNLVEALGYLSTLGSHRVSTDQALIRQGADAAIVRALLEHGERSMLVELQLNRVGSNRAQVNRSTVKPRELPRYFSSVLFAPEDLALVRGEPAARRRLLDQLLVLRSPRMASVLADYDRVLRQRNTLLKSARASGVKSTQLTTLEIWDDRLISLGAEITVARFGLVAALRPEVARAYAAIAGEAQSAALGISLSMLSAGGDEDAEDTGTVVADEVSLEVVDQWFRTAVHRQRNAELDRGLTLSGPHRDDLILTLNALPARGYASHGESWSFALALRLAAASVLRRDSRAGDPVLILDDVFAELDQTRRLRLAEAIDGFEQVLITAAVFDEVPPQLRENTVRIRAGRIEHDDGNRDD